VAPRLSRQHNSQSPRLTVASATPSHASTDNTLCPVGPSHLCRATVIHPLTVALLIRAKPLYRRTLPGGGGKSGFRRLRLQLQRLLEYLLSQGRQRVAYAFLRSFDPGPVGAAWPTAADTVSSIR
jgi:hypothetical protein